MVVAGNNPNRLIFIIHPLLLSNYSTILSSPIEYLKGVGPAKGALLQKELNVFTFKDLLYFFPFRHVDKTKVSKIKDINAETDYIQIAGKILGVDVLGNKWQKRAVAKLSDGTGSLDLVWFQGVSWIEKNIIPGNLYLVYGKPGYFNSTLQIAHPEIEPWNQTQATGKSFLEPIYPSTEKLKTKNLGGRLIGKLTFALFQQLQSNDIKENLSNSILQNYQLVSRYQALQQIHFPQSFEQYQQAVQRIKFEELFFSQLKLSLIRHERHHFSKGVVFEKVGDLFNNFYNNYLPFHLTNAQKRVIKEIRNDTAHGRQMNRLLQGDVGSGKTIVALLIMLLANDNNFQACLMAPTEVLAKQHFDNIKSITKDLPIHLELLTGSTKAKERKRLLPLLEAGEINILIGTHAVIEEKVNFSNLGLIIIDEQHRFGVAQRARLWSKAAIAPHVLIMTATPIPRTLAMTHFGDLDYSVIDELPAGRKPIITVHRFQNKRSYVMHFVKSEIDKGRQAYIVFPLIEESETLNYENLMQGYEIVKSYFPEPNYWISMVHGKQPAEQKEINMQRFINGETQVMVSTTVIEVGINVPNASVMVIESAEKFGLAQLHQLRGRVGRGTEQSYCILISGNEIGHDARNRLKIIERTQNGFEIAQKDLELRGPGEIEGTKQSGAINFRLANIIEDNALLNTTKQVVETLLEEDPSLATEENKPVKLFLAQEQDSRFWAKIS